MPRVLIADDNLDARAIYSGYLAWAGYEVVAVEDGLRALEKAAECGPDVIVMDVAMPGMDGWQATRMLKERAPEVPVILVTAGPSDSPRANASGCELVLTKPCLPQNLEEAVRNVLEARQRTGGAGVSSRGGSSPSD